MWRFELIASYIQLLSSPGLRLLVTSSGAPEGADSTLGGFPPRPNPEERVGGPAGTDRPTWTDGTDGWGKDARALGVDPRRAASLLPLWSPCSINFPWELQMLSLAVPLVATPLARVWWPRPGMPPGTS